jgi:hypothetical protein
MAFYHSIMNGIVGLFGNRNDEANRLFYRVLDDYNETYNQENSFQQQCYELNIPTKSKPKESVCEQLVDKLNIQFPGNRFTAKCVVIGNGYGYYIGLFLGNLRPFQDFNIANQDRTQGVVDEKFFDKAFPILRPDENGDPTSKEFILFIYNALSDFKRNHNIENFGDLYAGNYEVQIEVTGRVSSTFMQVIREHFNYGNKTLTAQRHVNSDDTKTIIVMQFSKAPQRVEPLMLTAGTPRRV